MDFKTYTLENGLEVVAECNGQAYSMGMGFFVNAGSCDETAKNSGVSHFLEHMVFKGTPKRSAADVNRELDEIGSHSNAYTSEEHTVYYAAALPEYQSQAVDLLSDIMRPSLRESDFDTEKKVIIEEICKYDDQPPFGAHEKCMAAFFGQHPLGRSVLGTTESVSALSPEAMREYFQRRYSPGNIKLVAAGCLDFEKLVADVEACCGDWEPFETKRTTQPPQGEAGFDLIERPSAAQQYIVQISGGPSAQEPERYAHRLLATIFGDEGGSRLFWALVDTGLVEYAASGTYEFQDTGITMTVMSCHPDSAKDSLERLRQLQTVVQTEPITENELELAKSKICSHIVRRSERPANRLFAVGSGWLQRLQYQTVKESVEAYQRVTVEDVNDIVAKYPLDQTATVVAGPRADW